MIELIPFSFIAAGLAVLLISFALIGYRLGHKDGATDVMRELRRSKIPVEFTNPEFVRAFNEFDALGQWPARR